MKSPCCFKKLIPTIMRQLILNFEPRGHGELKTACQLPCDVFPITASMRKKIMAFVLSLRPVTQVVYAQYPEWTCHADENPNIYERPFKQLGALIGFVDHHTMHPGAVPNKQRKICQDAKHKKSAPRKGQGTEDNRAYDQGAIPCSFLGIQDGPSIQS